MLDRETLNRTYRYCVSLTKDETMADELLQNSFVKFLGCKQALANPLAYLFQIIRHQFIDDLRKSRLYETEEFNEEFHETDVLEQNPLNLLIEKEEVERLLHLLNAGERELLFLWAVEEWTIQEIADHTQTPKGTLLSKLHRLKQKIKHRCGAFVEEVGV